MDSSNILERTKTIAIVGLSDNPERPSYEVATYLKSQGFTIIPINPNYTEILDVKVYPDLLAVPSDVKIDIVDIFRRSEDVLPHIKQAIDRGDVKTVWLQEGITNPEAEAYARNHGLQVIANFCLMKAHKRAKNEEPRA